MINRRFIREKVVQTLYAYVLGGITSIELADKTMDTGLKKTEELYLYHLSFLVALSEYFDNRFEIAKKKFLPTKEELNPNTRLVRNRVIEHIKNSDVYKNMNDAYRFNWHENEILLSNIYNQIIQSDSYRSYLKSEDNLKEDVDYLCRLYKNKIVENDTFREICEESSIFWASDYYSISYWVYRAIKEFGTERQDLLIDNYDEDLKFSIKLINEAILHIDEYQKIVYSYLENWEPERVAIMDKIILITAVSELIHFPSIPVKVTLNEFIELSKYFCSENTRIFVNGVLHKISVQLSEQGIIKKTGRGLI
ncbi:MAG: transcription antitermination protein NusB [Bacteroidales bacterium]|jgi:N utilization substance protein B|nr:transcription antitermination protein NusB [Bacteroidales bacterium]